ncbi:Uncharacterised protein [Pseudomonas fluorescens]|uniref:Uncharacterized protein n=1 Tax=Pseudomonas fluorescens TaxID=294 RepID=A0A379ID67_PSEFL|nr:Uncharacterised protein [Pseudomonas fluorescens]
MMPQLRAVERLSAVAEGMNGGLAFAVHGLGVRCVERCEQRLRNRIDRFQWV